jgi:trehalose/maltose hydrolase-like predicted phosphorylase
VTDVTKRLCLRHVPQDVRGQYFDVIHTEVMAGTLDLMERGYMDTEVRDRVLHFGPKLVERLEELSFPRRFRGTPMAVALEKETGEPEMNYRARGGSRDQKREEKREKEREVSGGAPFDQRD